MALNVGRGGRCSTSLCRASSRPRTRRQQRRGRAPPSVVSPSAFLDRCSLHSATMSADMSSSLPLQMSLYFHGLYVPVFVVLELLAFVYKGAAAGRANDLRRVARSRCSPRAPTLLWLAGVMLPYPPNALGLEVAFIFAYCIVEWARMHFGAGAGVCGSGGLRGGEERSHSRALLLPLLHRGCHRRGLTSHPPRQHPRATSWSSRARASSRLLSRRPSLCCTSTTCTCRRTCCAST